MQKYIAICITTYKRPTGLSRLLAALALQEIPIGCDVRIVVVDNEGSLLTRQICEESGCKLALPIFYCHEPRRGVSYVRNKAIEMARKFADYVVFIDDDEVPREKWLVHLVVCQEKYNADAVSGPVVPHFMASVPQWIIAGRFFDRDRHPTGTQLKITRTGNVMLKMNIMDRIGVFDEKYSFIGGEDSNFFDRVYKSGGSIVWSDEAVVEEWLPSSRIQLKWLLKRSYAEGIITDTFYHYNEGRSHAYTFMRGILRMGKGVCLMVISIPQGKPGIVKELRRILVGAGMIAGASGWQYEQYRKIKSV